MKIRNIKEPRVKKTILLAIVFFCSAMSFAFSAELIVPKPGLWVGDNLSFNVSEDGSKLTGTSNPSGESLRLHFTDVRSAFGIFGLLADIPIKNGKFSFQYSMNGNSIKIEGTFTSPNTATGKASFGGGIAGDFITDWVAKPKTP
jgi:hypothetical protein